MSPHDLQSMHERMMVSVRLYYTMTTKIIFTMRLNEIQLATSRVEPCGFFFWWEQNALVPASRPLTFLERVPASVEGHNL